MGHSLCIKCGKESFVDDRCKGCFKSEYEERVVKQFRKLGVRSIVIMNEIEPFVSIVRSILDEASIDAEGKKVMLGTLEQMNQRDFKDKVLGEGKESIQFFSLGPETHVQAYTTLLGLDFNPEQSGLPMDEFFAEIYEKQPQVVHALHNALEKLD